LSVSASSSFPEYFCFGQVSQDVHADASIGTRRETALLLAVNYG
jgi:hypothetical protein